MKRAARYATRLMVEADAGWRPFLWAAALMAVPSVSGCGTGTTTDQATATVASEVNTTFANGDYSDANGWNQAPYYSTIQYPDVNGDGATDVCGRGGGGIWCAVDDGKGHYVNDSLVASSFSDAAGWSAVQYYSTIQFPDVNGDGKADVCGRGPAGIWCATSINGSSFTASTLWIANFSDGYGWNQPQYYSTIRFPDINGDGKADVCGRGGGGIWCATSNGSSFAPAMLVQPDYSDGNGWGQAQYYSTIQFPDLNGDGKADVCGRGGGGIWCATSNGSSFSSSSGWQTDYSDGNGWAQPQYYSTIQFPDLNFDGKADVCGRGGGGMWCALSNGVNKFSASSPWDTALSDANGWNKPEHYQTIHIVGDTLCGRGTGGIMCEHAVGNSFLMQHGVNGSAYESTNESDANGWTGAPYYSTIRLTKDYKIVERGGAGIWSGIVAADHVTITTAAQATARRTALIQKVWGSPTLDTKTEVDSDVPATSIDIGPLPAGTTVRTYQISMPTSGGVPVAGGPAAVIGYAQHYFPANPTTKVALVNPGHGCSYPANEGDDALVAELLSDGYAVIATYMPLYNPVQSPPNCDASHNVLFENASMRPAGGGHPLVYFLDTVRRSLNHAIAKYGYTDIKLSGLSGGGWTTTLYTALDTRIQVGVSVAGNEPFPMRQHSDDEQEDVPSLGNDFFRFFANGHQVVTGYKDLYVLAGFGHRLVQVLNRNDDCCFGQSQYWGAQGAEWDVVARSYEAEVRTTLSAIGGSYRLQINDAHDTGNLGHEFSRSTRLTGILGEFDGKLSTVGVAAGGQVVARGANGHLFYQGNGNVWHDTGIAATGTPAVLANAIPGHTYDIFYRDPSNSNGHAYFDGASWHAAADVSGVALYDLSAVASGDGKVWIAGIGTDYNVYYAVYSGGSWGAWQLVSSTVQGVGAMALTSGAPGEVDLFFRGFDSQLNHYRLSGAGALTMDPTGLLLKSFASAVSSAGTMQVFGVGFDDHLHYGVSTGAAWSWSDLSATVSGAPASVQGSPSATFEGSAVVVYARVVGGLGQFRLNGGTWGFAGYAAPAALEGSPVATGTEVFVLSPITQSLWMFSDSPVAWYNDFQYFDR